MTDIEVVNAQEPLPSDELARSADEHDGVIVFGRWASEWPRLLEYLRKAGARWHRVVYIDERDPDKAGIGADSLVEAYRAYLEAVGTYVPVVVTDAGKTVSRRDLLRGGLGVFFVYTSIPDVLDEKCSSLKTCDLCLASCPYSALEGKPPKASEKKCTECGLCTSYCPTGLLYTPTHPPEAVKRLLYQLKKNGVQKLTVTCPLNRAGIYEREELRGAILELPCIATLRIQEYLLARQLGFDVAFFCPSEKREKCPKRRAVQDYLALISEAEGIIRPKPLGRPIYSDKITELAAPLAVDRDEWTPLARLELFRVKADENLCTLCGACVKACPTHSLTLTRDGSYRLLFNHSRCIGCNACVKICPEKALTIEKATNPSLLYSGKTIEIATSNVARCRKCGREIGPEKMIMRLDRKLAEKGVSKEQRENLWLCEECKKEATIEEFRKEIEKSLGLQPS